MWEEDVLDENSKKIRNDYFQSVIEFVKLFVLLIVTIVGFFTIYAVLWIALGIPTGWWAGVIVCVLTAASEFGLYKLLCL